MPRQVKVQVQGLYGLSAFESGHGCRSRLKRERAEVAENVGRTLTPRERRWGPIVWAAQNVGMLGEHENARWTVET